jgi:hypothetical protein
MAVPGNDPVSQGDRPAEWRDRSQRPDDRATRQRRPDHERRIAAGVDRAARFIDDVEDRRQAPIADGGRQSSAVGRRGVLKRQQLEPAVAIPPPQLTCGRHADPAITVIEDDEPRSLSVRDARPRRQRRRLAEVDPR